MGVRLPELNHVRKYAPVHLSVQLVLRAYRGLGPHHLLSMPRARHDSTHAA